MASKNIARLGVLLGLDMAQFNADMDKAVFATKRLEQEAKRSNERALKDARAIQLATEDYGKTLTKVQQIERAIDEGRYKGASDAALNQIRARAAAYDAEVASMRKVNAERLKAGGGLTPQQQAQIGYQMTDIFTSLMGGQNPMMVLIQQGGQLRDVFGGAGNALRAVFSTLTVGKVVVASAAATFAAFAYAVYAGAKEMERMRDDLILTNNIAGLTKTSFLALGDTIKGNFSITIGQARDIVSSLASSGKFAQTSIEAVGRAIAKYSELSGTNGKEAAQKLIPLLDGTASSARSLNNQFNFLTLAQYKQIEVLEKHGRLQEAIKLQANALTDSWSRQERELGFLEKAWNGLKNAASGAWDAMLGIGRDDPQRRIKELTDLIEQTKKGGRPAAYRYSRLSPQELRAQFEEELKTLRASLQAKEDLEKADAERRAKERKAIENRVATGGLEGEIQRIQELAKARIQAERSAFQQNQNELTQARIDYQYKVEDLVREMQDKNQKEGGRLAVHNQQVLNYKLIELANQFYQKQKDIKLKQYLDDQEERQKEMQKAEADMLKQIELRQIVALKNSEDLKNKQSEYKLEANILKLRQGNLFVTDAQIERERIRFDVAKQIADLENNPAYYGAENAELKRQEIEKIKRLGEVKSSLIDLQDQTKLYESLNNSVWQNMSQAIDNFVRTGKLSFKDLTRSIIQDLLMIQMRAQASRLLGLVGNLFAPKMFGPALPSGPLGPSFDQYLARADGGPVYGGSAYLVGERGPELFMPSGSGTIIPNHAMGSMGGVTNVTNNYINAIDVQSFEQRLLNSSNTIWAANQYANKSLAVAGGRA